MAEKLKGPITRREFLQIVGTGLMGAALAGCMPGGERITPGPTTLPTDTLPPAVMPTPKETEVPTEVPVLKVETSGGAYSERQIRQIEENAVLKEKVRVLTEEWVEWWATAAEPAISVDALKNGRINVVVKFDPRDPETGEKALVILESQDYPGQNIMQPWDFSKADFMTQVPDFDTGGKKINKSSGHPNVPGMGLFLMETTGNTLSDGRNISWIWQNVEGKPARVDATSGQLLERINQNGKWEKAGKEFILPKTEITPLQEVTEQELDPKLVEAMKVSVSALGGNFYIDKWGKGPEEEVVMVVKDKGYPEVELWGCPVYEEGIGSQLWLLSKEELRMLETEEIVRPTVDTGLAVDMSRGKGNEVRQFIKYFQGLREMLERRPKTVPEYRTVNQFSQAMRTWMDNHENTESFPQEVHLVTAIYTRDENSSIPLEWRSGSSMSHAVGMKLDVGAENKHNVFVAGMKFTWKAQLASSGLGMVRRDVGKRVYEESPEGDSVFSPENYSANDMVRVLSKPNQYTSIMDLFLAAAGDEEKFLVPSIWEEIWGRGPKSECLEILVEYGGWPGNLVGKSSYDSEEDKEKVNYYLSNPGSDFPVQEMRSYYTNWFENSGRSYFEPKVVRFEE